MSRGVQDLMNAIAADTKKHGINVEAVARTTGLQPWQAVRANVLTSEDESINKASKPIDDALELIARGVPLTVQVVRNVQGALYELIETAIASGYRCGFKDAETIGQTAVCGGEPLIESAALVAVTGATEDAESAIRAVLKLGHEALGRSRQGLGS